MLKANAMKDLNFINKVKVLIYRVNEKGLEVFLLKEKVDKHEAWKFPQSVMDQNKALRSETIALDPIQDEAGNTHYTLAVEGDYHDIPSIRGMIKSDLHLIKNRIHGVLPDLEKGTFIAAKETFKKLLPHEYAAVKELVEILVDRNSVTSI